MELWGHASETDGYVPVYESAELSQGETFGFHWEGGWVGPRARLEMLSKAKIFLTGMELGTSSQYPVTLLRDQCPYTGTYVYCSEKSRIVLEVLIEFHCGL
jgi:hypothetical protein